MLVSLDSPGLARSVPTRSSTSHNPGERFIGEQRPRTPVVVDTVDPPAGAQICSGFFAIRKSTTPITTKNATPSRSH
ncbi:MAG TPA: hypothetical protein VFD38_01175, partial [Myxococcaceae bacterium]|nr:hypothetical protein [Myxococcaceae bacterium]